MPRSSTGGMAAHLLAALDVAPAEWDVPLEIQWAGLA